MIIVTIKEMDTKSEEWWQGYRTGYFPFIFRTIDADFITKQSDEWKAGCAYGVQKATERIANGDKKFLE